MTTILRTTSHRSRDRLHAALGRRPRYQWTWDAGACFVEVSDDEARRVLPIVGATRARVDPATLRPCFPPGD